MAFDFLHNTRRRTAERMDNDAADTEELRRSLRFIRRVNSLLGYTRSVVRHLERFSRSWAAGQRIEIIDLATGSADVPRAVLAWAARRGFDVHITAVDRHARTIEEARRGGESDPRLTLVEGDVFNLPFAEGTFDYAMTNMFLHHLDEDGIVNVLRTMDRLARRGVIASDLLRRRRAYAWISLMTLLAGSMVRHDARASVTQALTKDEVLRLREAAGVGYARFHRHFGHRFVLAGEKLVGRR